MSLASTSTRRTTIARSRTTGKTITTPLLDVNGTRDPGNPVADMMMTAQSAVDSDLWLLGLGEHCAVEYYPVVMPHVVQWLSEKNAK